MSLWIARHGESTSNSGEDDCVDAPLSRRGIVQAQDLIGSFDLIVCSPLLRTRQTLEHSHLQHGRLFNEPLCRERIIALRDCLHDEEFRPETDQDFFARVERFKIRLGAWRDVFDRVLVIGHAYFFAACFDRWGVQNGQLCAL